MPQASRSAVRSGIVILARLTSVRLPRKSLRTIAGKTVLEHQIERLSTSRETDHFVLATTSEPVDDELCRVAVANGIDCFRGEPEDVVLRLIQTADRYGLDLIVLVSGDILFCEGWLVDAVVTAFRDDPADFIRIGRQPFEPAPWGITRAALHGVMAIKAGSTDGWDRYLTDTGRFRVIDVPLPVPHLDDVYVRLDLDYPEDLALYQAVYDRLYRDARQPSLQQVIRLLTVDEPHLVDINKSAAEKWRENRERAPLVLKDPPEV